jgi:hypothetical protein
MPLIDAVVHDLGQAFAALPPGLASLLVLAGVSSSLQ